MAEKQRAPRNRTITLTPEDRQLYAGRIKHLSGPVQLPDILDTTINQDTFQILEWLPEQFVDLLIVDPPYNTTRSFNDHSFHQMPPEEYEHWFEAWMTRLARILKHSASLYVCSDWRSSTAIHNVLDRHFIIRNRITWEREKGRGASTNWKNASEDIWFATVSDAYTFNLEAVKIKRRVIAPYTDGDGNPKDWAEAENGRFRLTHPSNIWTDLTVPFWSMSENTDHPTQKPEKLLAKIILASSKEADVILDPFLGSGTTSVVARKLRRHYVGIEIDEEYCLLAEKRLALAEANPSIQGYCDGVFWERNTSPGQSQNRARGRCDEMEQLVLFSEATNVEGER